MGNLSFCPHLKRPQEAHINVQEKMENIDELSTASVMLPSICDESSLEQIKRKVTKDPSCVVVLPHLEQMLYEYRSTAKKYKLTPELLASAKGALQVVRNHIYDICGDLGRGTYRFEANFFAKFEELCDPVHSTRGKRPTKERAIIHYFMALDVHNIILNRLTAGDDTVYSLLEQIAISHALMGVAREYFITMNVNILRYWTDKKITGEAIVEDVAIYLNLITNYILEVYEYQDGRRTILRSLLSSEKDQENDRSNKARHNYRLMKDWANFIYYLDVDYSQIQDIINVSHVANRPKIQDLMMSSVRLL